MTDDRYRSRKFALAAVSALVSHIALFSGQLEGGTWVAAQTLILGMYNAGNVGERYVKPD
ncbi:MULTISPECIES: hypothetical protein [Neptunomonas]|uniref:Uncharacterized protein n=1 Tax=Neptunomonas marina TaxID=1815562 RepID=A0A437QDS9_9GAMM|nr:MULTISPECIES: hypothetical protein [Neptunomonas]RVU32707.1 hypothetical protein EOE65_03365 [Neptunomonas marina]